MIVLKGELWRKSAKAKDKKQKRKEESERTDRCWKLVDEADRVEDVLKDFVSFKKFTRNGLNLDLECFTSANLDPDILNWAFLLTKENMQNQYESNWGWNDKEKLKELKEDRIKFLVAFDENKKPVAFTSFRFDLDFGEPVVYCYEIQLINSVQRKGLGKFLIQILHLFAIRYQMHKVVATVLHTNTASRNFFIEKLKYTTDDTSPLDECYEIISKSVTQRN
uniref:N-alpha-acetyltransferase 40 n=1 Tax=Phallusia mammillata TaxID=59560 RepID=A0A6F9DM17_9ASCI|nr:N-alpha-acetyltransferase 40 [Phallusia mammillata]